METNATERDPWEDDEATERDPWEEPEGTDLVTIEEEGSDDVWTVKYADTIKPPTSRDLESRDKRVQFLDVVAKTGNLKLAAAKVGLTPRALYLARQRHTDFDAQWTNAVNIYNMFVANESLRKRAIEGFREPVWYQGNIVGYQIRHDSGITQFFFKGAMPEVYGDKREIKIEGGLTYGIALLPPTIKDASEWEKSASLTQERLGKMIDITPNKEPVKEPAKNNNDMGRG